jgi:LmbE family N-acetylglucosaminyl deacetylase
MERPDFEQPTLFVTAHPDDLEVMLGYKAMLSRQAYALIASNGEKGIHRTGDEHFVANGYRATLESAPALTRLGIPASPERQIFLGEPDGDLTSRQDVIAKHISSIVTRHAIRRVVSLGDYGFNGHPDHIASHQAAVLAVDELREDGYNISHLALNHAHRGERVIVATPEMQIRKLGAMSCHRSQFGINAYGPGCEQAIILGGYAIDPDFWSGFQPFKPLVTDRETYDELPDVRETEDYLEADAA